jgi:hypothetical protein
LILKKITLNALSIAAVSFFAFLAHLFINTKIDSPIRFGQLVYSYVLNIILALSVVAILYILKRKLKDQLGFIFMAASMLKFVFFFILFYPEYTSDDILSRYEFFTFFIPYIICLIMECIILSRFLNGLDTDN